MTGLLLQTCINQASRRFGFRLLVRRRMAFNNCGTLQTAQARAFAVGMGFNTCMAEPAGLSTCMGSQVLSETAQQPLQTPATHTLECA